MVSYNMQTVLICLNPAVSHFLPTMELANKLVDNKFRVIYAGFSKLYDVVTCNGFDFISFETCSFIDFNNAYKKWKIRKYSEYFKGIEEEIISIIKKYNVDICLYDISRFNMFFLANNKMNVPMISFWTCSGATHINLSVPPNSSVLIPNNKRYQKLFVFSQWIKRYIKKEFLPKRIITKFYYPYPEIRKIARKEGLQWKYNIDSPYLDGEKVILGSSAFEFPMTELKSYYTGLSIAERNQDINKDFNWNWYDETKELIYCSLGTMCNRYPYSRYFFYEVIKAASKNSNWQVIVNIGDLEKFDEKVLRVDACKNIRIVRSVPQMDVLPKASLVLTHGGYGTIKECIYYGVPMIVFPCTYDQPGNAARVAFHEIGLRCSMKKADSKIIENMINEIIRKKEYYQDNLSRIKIKIRESDNIINIIQMIESLVGDRNE